MAGEISAATENRDKIPGVTKRPFPGTDHLTNTFEKALDDGTIVLPIEKRISLPDLIKNRNRRSFEVAAHIVNAEWLAIASTAAARIHGDNSMGHFREIDVDAYAGKTAENLKQEALQDAQNSYKLLGVDMGASVMAEYIREIDRAAKQITDKYPGVDVPPR